MALNEQVSKQAGVHISNFVLNKQINYYESRLKDALSFQKIVNCEILRIHSRLIIRSCLCILIFSPVPWLWLYRDVSSATWNSLIDKFQIFLILHRVFPHLLILSADLYQVQHSVSVLEPPVALKKHIQFSCAFSILVIYERPLLTLCLCMESLNAGIDRRNAVTCDHRDFCWATNLLSTPRCDSQKNCPIHWKLSAFRIVCTMASKYFREDAILFATQVTRCEMGK